jgi:hypothetical protein
MIMKTTNKTADNKSLLRSLTAQKENDAFLRNSALNRFIVQNKNESKQLDRMVKVNNGLLAVMSMGLLFMAFKGL